MSNFLLRPNPLHFLVLVLASHFLLEPYMPGAFFAACAELGIVAVGLHASFVWWKHRKYERGNRVLASFFLQSLEHQDVDSIIASSNRTLRLLTKKKILISESNEQDIIADKTYSSSNKTVHALAFNKLTKTETLLVCQLLEMTEVGIKSLELQKSAENEKVDAITHASDVHMVIDSENLICEISLFASVLFGLDRGDTLQEDLPFEDDIRFGDNWWDITATRMDDEHSVVVFKNCTKRHIQKRTDPHTGHLNIVAYNETGLPNEGVASMIELTNFNNLHGTYGPGVSRPTMKEFCDRIQSLSPNYNVYRVSLNFVVVITSDDISVQEHQDALRGVLDSPIETTPEFQVALTGIVGSIKLDPDMTTGEVSRKISAACASGHNMEVSNAVYDDSVQTATEEDYKLQTLLSTAVKDPSNNGFTLNFQPLLDAHDRICAFEALMRWAPEGQNVSPEKFIKLLEQSGLIKELESWLVSEACTFLKKMQETLPLVRMQVNISATHLDALHLGELSDIALGIVDNPQDLIFEIIESSQETDKILPALKVAKSKGFAISIDDFGTGSSNFERLLSFPASQVKLAGIFAEEIISNQEMVESWIKIFHIQGVEVVAEAVESAAQLEAFKKAKINLIQGWVFAKAMSPQEIDEWMQSPEGSQMVLNTKS